MTRRISWDNTANCECYSRNQYGEYVEPDCPYCQGTGRVNVDDYHTAKRKEYVAKYFRNNSGWVA